MINLILMFIFAVLFFVFFCALKPTTLHKIIGWCFAALFAGSVFFAIINESFHYGMTKETQSKTENLVSSVPKVPILLYQKLDKKGDETIYLYRTDENQKKPTATEADIMVHNNVICQGKEAKYVQKTTTWMYKNKVIEFFFKYPNKEKEVAAIDNEFYVPSTWKVMTVDELKAMKKQMMADASKMKAKKMAEMKKAEAKKEMKK